MEISEFNFPPGRRITGKYRVLEKIGAGLEGEVYKIEEANTGIHRAAKVFFPRHNPGGKACRTLSRKLHKLRDCSILIQYHHQETIPFRRTPVEVMISEYIDGEPLKEFLHRQRGGYLPAFQACHLLHALASGIAEIHQRGEYHGDLHTGNILVTKFGLSFSLKVIDFYHRDFPKQENIREDIIDMIKIFHEALGGRRRYASLPQEVKTIVCGLKRSLILKKFPSARSLKSHLESMTWA